MMPIINIIFFLSALLPLEDIDFSWGDAVYCKKVSLKVDLKNNTAILQYHHLMIATRDEKDAAEIMKVMEDATTFQEGLDWKLLSKKFYEENGQLNAVVHFSYKKEEETLQRFSIFRNKDRSYEALVYMMENLEHTNGKIRGNPKPGDLTEIGWEKDVSVLELELSRTEFKDPEMNNTVDLIKYWKK